MKVEMKSRKNQLKWSAFWACLLLVVIACRKELKFAPNQKQEQTAAANQSTEKIEPIWYANPENPYDELGIYHNKVLAELRRALLKGHDTSRIAKAKISRRYFLEQEGRDIRRTVRIMEPMVAALVAGKQVEALEAYPSPHLKDTFVRVRELIDNSPDIEGFVAAVKDLEQELLDMDMEEKHREAVLGALSVARHSGAFWNEVMQDEPVRDDGRGLPKWLNFIVRWQAAVTSDFAAATIAYATFGQLIDGGAVADFSFFVHDGIRDFW